MTLSSNSDQIGITDQAITWYKIHHAGRKNATAYKTKRFLAVKHDFSFFFFSAPECSLFMVDFVYGYCCKRSIGCEKNFFFLFFITDRASGTAAPSKGSRFTRTEQLQFAQVRFLLSVDIILSSSV